MPNIYPLRKFYKDFNDSEKCLNYIVKLKYPGGIVCDTCQRITQHYKIKNRLSYTCKFCRTQTNPLVGTLFEKSSTPLSAWFMVLYLMTQTRGNLSTKTLQTELGITYKTAWRMRNNIYKLMQKNKGDLLRDTNISKWVIFNAIELKVVRKT